MYETCVHGVYKGYVGGYCDECDEEEYRHGGLDKCLCCGRYKWADELTDGQVCKVGCRNPNEY